MWLVKFLAQTLLLVAIIQNIRKPQSVYRVHKTTGILADCLKLLLSAGSFGSEQDSN